MSAFLNRRPREHFEALNREEVADAIRDMKAMGFSDYAVASATGLSVEQIRSILAERRETTPA